MISNNTSLSNPNNKASTTYPITRNLQNNTYQRNQNQLKTKPSDCIDCDKTTQTQNNNTTNQNIRTLENNENNQNSNKTQNSSEIF